MPKLQLKFFFTESGHRMAIENAAASTSSEVLRESSPPSESPELEVSVVAPESEEPSCDAELPELLPPSSHRFRLHAALKRLF